jgi:hypothetical protein
MILDRDLRLDLFEVALRVASDPSPESEKRKLLTVALRDYVSSQEAEGKTKKCLSRVWVSPPEKARDMIAWARNHPQLALDPRLLHLGALLATFPFVGGVTGVIGRATALDGRVEPAEVRRRARALWGDRSSIDVGARKVYTTLLRLGVLEGGGRGPLVRGAMLGAEGEMAAWTIHALLLTRGVTAVTDSELGAAPELFWTKLSRPGGGYPLLARHSESGHRGVWVAEAPFGTTSPS